MRLIENYRNSMSDTDSRTGSVVSRIDKYLEIMFMALPKVMAVPKVTSILVGWLECRDWVQR